MSLLVLMAIAPTPTFDAPFLSGVLPAGLTYTNSSTTRTYFASSGLIATAAANAPIFEYNPVTLALLGMRWEMEQRTNLCLYSTLPGGGAAPTGWTRPGGTGTSAPVASIYGDADGSVAYEQSGTAQRPFLSQTISVSASTTYTLSVLVEGVTGTVKADDMALITAVPAGATVSYPVCPANPAGSGSGTLTTGMLETRVVVAGTAGTVGARVGLGATTSATGTVKFSRPQFEAGASRSSFIPTTTAAVTRQPDVLTASSISWYRQDEGTVLFEGIATDASSIRGFFMFSDGSDINRTSGYINVGAATTLVRAASVNQASISSVNTTGTGSVFRTGHFYKADDFGAVLNGGTVATDTTGTVPAITSLAFGVRTVSVPNGFMGYARRFQYFNTRLPNSQIQGMSRV